MNGLILPIGIALYIGTYYAVKLIAQALLKCDRDFLRQRFAGLIGVWLVAIVAASLARAAFVDQALYQSLTPFDQGRYVGQVIAIPITPAIFTSIAILFRMWQASRRWKEREHKERASHRPSPQW